MSKINEWPTPREVSTNEIPLKGRRGSVYPSRARELILRLSKTKKGKALVYSFSSPSVAENARRGLKSALNNRFKDDYVTMFIRGRKLYISHGPSFEEGHIVRFDE
jgi:hypothetical protein